MNTHTIGCDFCGIENVTLFESWDERAIVCAQCDALARVVRDDH